MVKAWTKKVQQAGKNVEVLLKSIHVYSSENELMAF